MRRRRNPRETEGLRARENAGLGGLPLEDGSLRSKGVPIGVRSRRNVYSEAVGTPRHKIKKTLFQYSFPYPFKPCEGQIYRAFFSLSNFPNFLFIFLVFHARNYIR